MQSEYDPAELSAFMAFQKLSAFCQGHNPTFYPKATYKTHIHKEEM